MPTNPGLNGTLANLARGRETRPLVVLLASLAGGLLLGGVAIAGVWTYGYLAEVTAEEAARRRMGGIDDHDFGRASLVAAGLWLVVLAWIWRPVLRVRGDLGRRAALGRLKVLGPVTLAVAGAVAIGGVAIDQHQPVPATDYAIVALALLGGGVILLLWMPFVDGFVYGTVDPDAREAVVRCARCEHSMVGLREAVCPECGQSYTLDELLAAQPGGAATTP